MKTQATKGENGGIEDDVIIHCKLPCELALTAKSSSSDVMSFVLKRIASDSEMEILKMIRPWMSQKCYQTRLVFNNEQTESLHLQLEKIGKSLLTEDNLFFQAFSSMYEELGFRLPNDACKGKFPKRLFVIALYAKIRNNPLLPHSDTT